MVSAIKQYGVVGKEGRVEVSANLPEGTKVEIIILVETMGEPLIKPKYETEYLLSTVANRQYLLEALTEIENPQNYVYLSSARGHPIYRAVNGSRNYTLHTE
jgi:hypothetical protein